MILTTPLLERLAQDGPVHVVATPASAGILANHPAVASVIVFDKRVADRGLAGMRRIAAAVRATDARRAYLAQGSLRTAAVAWLAGVPERIGFATSPGRLLYTRQVAFDRTHHHAQRLWQLGGPATNPRANPRANSYATPTVRPSLYPSPADHARVDELLRASGVDAGDVLIALAPGSVWATKRWPSYDALAAELATRRDGADPLHGARIVVVGGADDAPLAAAIVRALEASGHASAIDATGRLSLLASAALLARARVLITNDSAPLHLASAMNTPTVALFGPTVPAFGFGPLADVRAIVQHEQLDCRPCGAHGPQRCPLGHWRCMRELTPATIRARAVALAVEATGQ